VLFDYDGVIGFCDWKLMFKCYKAIFKAEGKDYRVFFKNKEELRKWWVPHSHENWKKAGIDNSEKINEVFNRVFFKNTKEIPESILVLKKLSKNHDIALVTNSKKTWNHLKRFLKEYEKLFKVVIGREDCFKGKPSPEGVNKVLKELEIGKEDRVKVLLIGDRPEDIIAGQRAGIKTAALVWKKGLGRREDFKDSKPDFILQSINQLPEILKLF